jgi:hypothetical protein
MKRPPPMPADIKRTLHAEGLDRGEFEWDIARPQVFDPLAFKHDTPASLATEFLETHPWPSTPAGQLDRRIWALHAAGRSNRSIGDEVGLYRMKVNAIVNRLRKLAEGRLTRGARPGRPADERFGRGARGTVRVAVRFNEAELTALYYAEDKLRLAGKIPPVRKQPGRDVLERSLSVVIRLALIHFARGL